MSELSDTVDPHWSINGQVCGARYVGVRPSHNNEHLNFYIDHQKVPIQIPNPTAMISDTKYGVVVSV